MRLRLPLLFLLLLPFAAAAATPEPFALREGDRVAFLGDGLVEGEQHHGWIELMLTTRFAERAITFRNLGWNGDTPAGDSRFGLSLLQAGHEPADEGWRQLVRQLEETRPTVLLVGYGMASSFDGEAGLARFRADYARLLDEAARVAPGVRLVLLSPLPHEALGAPWPDAAPRNAALARYAAVVAELAQARGARHVPLFELLSARRPAPRFTANGIHPTGDGYRELAVVLEEALLGGAGEWRASPRTEVLRQAILRKNEWFFHRSRPANMAYIFGFRKREQGRNAAEVLRFDEFIAAEEQRIARLRPLQPADVPELPRRIGNAAAVFTPQARPEFEVGEGLEVTLWAENPLLHKPIQMNFDARGRLWVASSELYPQIEPGQAATDRILILEDATGAGRATKATVFADGLLIPTGLEVGDGGVYVAQSTELLHFRDTNGDDRADERRVVLSGFGTEDTHHNLHTLRWGVDGRLNLAQSVYTRTTAETPHGVVRLRAGGIFALDPRNLHTEVRYRGWVNTWGHQIDDFGQSFATDGAGNAGISWAIPGATYRTLAPARRVLASITPGTTPKYCGLEIIRSRHFPDDWQGDFVTADFRAHRLVRYRAEELGSGYVTRELPDLLRTTAASFRPIDLRMGPDGALYVADWSNPIIQHGEVDFRDPRRDKAHGRIWRIAYKGRPALPRVDLTQLPNPELLDRLAGPDGYTQEQARRVLLGRGAAIATDLAAWSAAPRTEPARLQARWLRQALDLPAHPDDTGLLGAQDPRVRAAAVRALPVAGALPALTRLAADPHPRVRLEAVRALGRQGTLTATDVALGVLGRPMDPYLDHALWLTLNELATPWLAGVADGTWNPAGREAALEFGLRAVESARAAEVLAGLLARQGLPRDGRGPWIELIGAAGGPAELTRLFGEILAGAFPEPVAARALEALVQAARVRDARPTGDLAALGALLESPAPAIRRAAVPLAGAWKLQALAAPLATAAGRPGAAPAERAAAFTALRDLGGPAVPELRRLAATEGTDAGLRREAVVALAGVNLNAALAVLPAVFRLPADEAAAETLWRGLLGVRGASARLATELPKDPPPAAIARAGLRPAREGNQHQAIVPVLLQAAGLTLGEAAATPEALRALAAEALARGDAARGERLYRRAELACVACHAIGGAGGRLGPDLTSIGASAPADYLVESMLNPGAKIKEGYHAMLLATADGQEHSGMVVREAGGEVVLRTAANQLVTLPARTITRRTSIGSLMPAGLIDGLLPEERLDLFRFLIQLGKPGDYDAARGGVARFWRIYNIVSANQHLGAERVVQGDFALEHWATAYSLVSGRLPADAFAGAFNFRQNSRGLYAATQFETTRAGPVTFTLEGAATAAWVNGRAVRPGATFTAEARAGLNTVVLQVDATEPPAALRLAAPGVAFRVE